VRRERRERRERRGDRNYGFRIVYYWGRAKFIFYSKYRPFIDGIYL
jgi:hypothetical protein